MENTDGPFITTLRGLRYHFHHPERYPYEIDEIATCLSRICRFTGHIDEFYSVAQHSVLVSKLLETWGESPLVAYEGLMHDKTEFVLGDVSTPLKSLLPDYKFLEELAEKAMNPCFGLPLQQTPAVKKADDLMYEMERDQLKNGLWRGIMPLAPCDARTLFMARHAQLRAMAFPETDPSPPRPKRSP